MANWWVGTGEWGEAATASAQSERSGQPATHLTGRDPRRSWRSVGLSSQWIELDRGASGEPFDYLTLVRWNPTATGTFDVDVGNSTPPGTSIASGVSSWVSSNQDRDTWPWVHTHYLFSTQRTERYVRVSFTDSGIPGGDFIVGCLRVGLGWRFVKNPIYGAGMPGFRKRGGIVDLPGGGTDFLRRNPVQNLPFTMVFYGSDGYDDWIENAYRIDRLHADHSPVVLIRDDDPTDGHLITRIHYGPLILGKPTETRFGQIIHPGELQGWA